MKKIISSLPLKLISLFIFMMTLTTSINVTFASRVKNASADKYKPMIDAINTYSQYGVAFITVFALMAFVYNIVRVGAAGTNTSKRSDAIRGLIISGSVAALVPLSSTILFVFLNFSK